MQLLVAVPHPASGEQEVRIALRDVLAIESTRILLDGRLTVTEVVPFLAIRTLVDGPRQRVPVPELRREIIAEERRSTRSSKASAGEALNMKFAAAESRELDPDEQLLARIFVAPRLAVQKKLVLPKPSPGRRGISGSNLAPHSGSPTSAMTFAASVNTASSAASHYLSGIRSFTMSSSAVSVSSLCGRLRR